MGRWRGSHPLAGMHTYGVTLPPAGDEPTDGVGRNAKTKDAVPTA